MNRTERLQEVLRLEALAAAARDRAAFHRVALDEEARAELAREGSAPTWRMPDIGSVILPVSKEEPIVTDVAALLAWCKERHPGEVEQVEQIRPAFQTVLLGSGIVAGDVVVHPGTGEVLPGMAVRPAGQPKALTIRPTKEARAVFAAIGARMLEDILAPDLEPVGHLEPSEVAEAEGQAAA